MAKIDWDKLEDAPKSNNNDKYSALHNFLAGAANPNINMANWVIEKGHKLGSSIGIPDKYMGKDRPIPNIPYKGGIPSFIGTLAGYIPAIAGGEATVGLGALKGAKLLEKIAPEAKSIGKVAIEKFPRLAKIGKMSSIGALSSISTRSPNQTDKSAAIIGAIGGGVGEGVQGVLSKTTNPIFRSARFQNFKKDFMKGKLTKSTASAQRDALNHIADVYNGLRTKASNMYKPIWDKLNTTNSNLKPSDIDRTLSLIDKEGTNSLIDESDIYKAPDEVGSFDPEQFHYLRSKLFQEGVGHRYKMRGRDARQAFKYADAMRQDLDGFLKKKKLYGKYSAAQDNWNKTILPYIQSKIFRSIYPEMKYGSEQLHSTEGLPISSNDFQHLKETAPISKLARKLLPGSGEETDNKIAEFTNLLGNDRPSAIQHIRNLLFSKYYNSDNSTVDIKSLMKDMNTLKDENREAILTPVERKQLSELKSLDKLKLTPAKRSLLALGSGALFGHHFFGMHPEAIGGSTLGAMILDRYLDPIAKASLENRPMMAIEKGLRRSNKIGAAGIPIAQQYVPTVTSNKDKQ